MVEINIRKQITMLYLPFKQSTCESVKLYYHVVSFNEKIVKIKSDISIGKHELRIHCNVEF